MEIGHDEEFDETGEYVDLEHEFVKEEYMEQFAAQMQEALDGSLDIPVRVFVKK